MCGAKIRLFRYSNKKSARKQLPPPNFNTNLTLLNGLLALFCYF